MGGFWKMLQLVKKCVFIGLISAVMLVANAAPPRMVTDTSANTANKPVIMPVTPSVQPPSQANTTPTAMPMIIPAPPNINAKAYVLMDANSGRIIVAKNMDQKRPPASLTKLMTLYLISQALHNGTINLNDKVLISKDAWRMGGSKMFVKVGTYVPVKDLLQGIIVDSGNDACVAMSEFVSGSQDSFTSMMNMQAQALGMNNTHYTDCTGLPHLDHYSTAHDLAILARAIINNFPEYYPWYKQKWFTYNGIRQPNRNRLLWRYPNADGLKTGHTKAAGYCLVSSAVQNGMRLISVVMGAPTDEARATDSIRLLTYGFRFFKTYSVYAANTAITKLRVWFGAAKKVPVGIRGGLYVTTPMGQLRHAMIKLNMNGAIKAPITVGEVVGGVAVTANGKLIAQAPLIALIALPKGGVWRRGMDHIEHLFHSWFGKPNITQTIPMVTKS